MVDAGIGPAQMKRLLGIMNIPTPDEKTLKKRESEAGEAIENQAKLSCKSALEEEVEKTENGRKKITASFDGAWQTGGSGRSYKSLSDSRIVAALSNERNCVSLMNADDLRDTAKAVNNSMSQNSVQDVSENENTDRVSDSEDDE
ncbi:uncharacterized protein LOC110251906 [Exaiptasia diaphana]|uniref:Mutator-like transposase domain-containing protein n=1 Tax=Exaiptasia diaphana TaxID=2652724 RepID=A0A913YUN6_EXADI|nr:uncharacterized protein LOC110251906 [Exaiptasia diaphana]